MEGLVKLPDAELRAAGKATGTAFLHSNRVAFASSGGYMYEKYDAWHIGKYGGGGE